MLPEFRLSQQPTAQPLTGNEYVYVIQNGQTVKALVSQFGTQGFPQSFITAIGENGTLAGGRTIGAGSAISMTDNGAGNQFLIGVTPNPVIPGTAGMVVPTGTTAQQNPVNGQIRYNSDTSRFEFYQGNTFVGLTSQGTVTSVTVSFPSIFSVTGNPITGSGTITASLASQFANLVLAGPTTGGAASPTFRSLVGADLPAPGLSALGGIQAAASVSHQWIDSISTSGVPHLSQPAASDISGLGTMATQDASAVAITGGTITGMPTPTANSDVATKSYVDNVTTGLTLKAACRVASTANLNATYSNGASGVGATLTNAGAQAALTIDGVALSAADRVLVKNQTTQANNGIYTVTTVGDGSTNWVLTRATDYDQTGEVASGSYTVISAGTANIGTLWIESGVGPFTIGTTAIVFTSLNIGSVVTSVALALPAFITVSGSPVTSAGTLTGTLANQTANLVFAGPSSGGAAAPTFRALVVGDMPGLGTMATQAASAVNITGGAITGMSNPVNPSDVANKSYVDANTSISSLRASCRAATTANLTATYSNGASGVGATLTNSGAQVALVIDGVTMIVADRVIVKDQTTQANNGIYTVTTVGSGSTNWVLTRALDFNAPSNVAEGAFSMVSEGTTNAGCLYIENSSGPFTIGTTVISFLQNGSGGVGGLVNPNLIYAGPGTGSPASPNFRAMVGADLPTPTVATLGGIQAVAAVSHQFITSITTAGVPVLAQPAFTDISGSVTAAQLPNPSATTLGGTQSIAAVAHQWVNSISTLGVPTLVQPNFTDLAGTISTAQSIGLGVLNRYNNSLLVSTYEFADYANVIAGADATASLQAGIVTCYLTSVGRGALGKSDQGNRVRSKFHCLASYPITIKSPICNLPFVEFDFPTQMLRAYDATGTVSTFYNGDTTTKALANVYMPCFYNPPLAHVAEIDVNLNPDGVHYGSGGHFGRAWIMTGGAIGVAGNGGYSVNDLITLSVGGHKTPYKGATFRVATIDGSGNPTSLTFVQGGVYPAPPKILRQMWSTGTDAAGRNWAALVAAGALNIATVFDGSGNYVTTGGTGTGLTINVLDDSTNWAPDFAGGQMNSVVDFSGYQCDSVLGHIKFANSGSTTDATYGPMRAFFITSLNHYVHTISTNGGYYGNVIYATDMFIGNTIYNVGAAKAQFVKFAGSNLHGRIICDTPAGPNGYYFDIDHFQESNLEIVCFNNGTQALTGLTYAGFIGGKNIQAGDTNQVDGCNLNIYMFNAGNATGLPAVFIDYCAGTKIKINATNRVNNAQAAFTINKLAVLGSHNGVGNTLEGVCDGISGAIVTGTFTGWGINVRDDYMGGYLRDGGIYDIYGSGAPTNGGAGTGLNKAILNSRYHDTASGNNYINFGTSTTLQWQPEAIVNQIPAGSQTSVTNGTSPYTVKNTDYEVFVDTTGGAVTLNLPDPTLGRYRFKIKDTGGAFNTNNCTLHRFGSEKIEGLTSDLILRADNGNYEFQSDGTNWWKMSAACNTVQLILTGSGNVIIPAGVSTLTANGRGGSGGGGGGGGGGAGSTSSGAGGGAGGSSGGSCISVPRVLRVTPGSTYAYVCGVAGTAGASGAGAAANPAGATGTAGGAGGNGGQTTFGSLAYWVGGFGGLGGNPGTISAGGAAVTGGTGYYGQSAGTSGAGGNPASAGGAAAVTGMRLPFWGINLGGGNGGASGGVNGGGGGGGNGSAMPGDADRSNGGVTGASGGNAGANGANANATAASNAGQGGWGGTGAGGGGLLATTGTAGGNGAAGAVGFDGQIALTWQE